MHSTSSGQRQQKPGDHTYWGGKTVWPTDDERQNADEVFRSCLWPLKASGSKPLVSPLTPVRHCWRGQPDLQALWICTEMITYRSVGSEEPARAKSTERNVPCGQWSRYDVATHHQVYLTVNVLLILLVTHTHTQSVTLHITFYASYCLCQQAV